MSETIFGITRDHAHAEQIIGKLNNFGFSHGKISVLFRYERVQDATEKRVGWMETDEVVTGSVLFLLTNPGKDGSRARSCKRGIAEILQTFGASQLEAEQYEEDLKKGNILLGFHAEDSLEAKVVKMIFLAENLIRQNAILP